MADKKMNVSPEKSKAPEAPAPPGKVINLSDIQTADKGDKDV